MKYKFSVLFFLVFLMCLLSCSPDVTFTGMDGFKFGMSEQEILNLCKQKGFVINQKYMGYEKHFGKHKGSVFMVFDKEKKLKAFDIKFYPMLRKPEVVRDTVMSLRDTMNESYMKGSNTIKGHDNFAVLYTRWEFTDSIMFLGTYEQDFASCPRIIIIRKDS